MEMTIGLTDLPSFAHTFWELVHGHRIFAFHGEMGAGKTTVIIALCLARRVKDAVGSPTFSIINQYGFEEDGEQKKIFHIDLYRLKDKEEIEQAGVEDCIYSDAISFVEWPEKAPQLFDETAVHVFITAKDETTRTLKINLPA